MKLINLSSPTVMQVPTRPRTGKSTTAPIIPPNHPPNRSEAYSNPAVLVRLVLFLRYSLFARGNWEPIKSPLINETTKNSNLNKREVFRLSRYVFATKNIKGNPIEKHIIARSILEKSFKQLSIRFRTFAISIAPQAAPAMKDATRRPIHENTCP
jgi:hypothetical protein